MRIHIGCELTYNFTAPTPMIIILNVHHSRVSELERPDHLVTTPPVPVECYRDGFGNWCSRLVAPPGIFVMGTDTMIQDSGEPDAVDYSAIQHPVEHLPGETLEYLLGSRYCETERLSNTAWGLFSASAPGWQRVQAICDYVHSHVTFGYEFGRPSKTAAETWAEGNGVCRDFTHLAITLCRCMNIPARYCTGYISDIGYPTTAPMDFAAWMEVYLGGRWWVFDPRNNQPRWGRILIARGRDAADVPMSLTFGDNMLRDFKVWTDEVDTNGQIIPPSPRS